MQEQEYYTLYNGVKIPKIGFGTYKVTDDTAESVLCTALLAGYRHIDTARMYGNETQVGNAIRTAGIDRKDLFLTTKVWRSALSYDDAMRSIEASLQDLQTDYLDLCLLHWPMPEVDRDAWAEKVISAWHAMEKLYEQKVLRAIGVSNFLPHHLMPLMVAANITPMVDQLEFHPGYTQSYAVSYCQSQGLLVEAWSPLGRTKALDDPFLLGLAQKYGKTPAQICLRFALEQHILPLPKSSSLQRMQENLDIFDFSLTPEEVSRLMTAPQGQWSGHHPDTF